MNGDAHNIIIQNAVVVLPDDMRKVFNSYPDLFDDSTSAEGEKIKTDPQWQKYCIYPDDLAGKTLQS